jgi:hypothetical protein
MGEPADVQEADPLAGALNTARREFKEETGLTLENARVIGSFYPDSGLLENLVYAVRGTISSAPTSTPDAEGDELILLLMDSVHSLIDSGCITDGITLAAIALMNRRWLRDFKSLCSPVATYRVDCPGASRYFRG